MRSLREFGKRKFSTAHTILGTHGSRREMSVEERETIQGCENETSKQCCWELLQKEVV